MGSFIELNDTLRITKEQGFPAELDLEKHLKDPYKLEDVANKVFKFHAKPDIRVYKIPPVRNFLVQEIVKLPFSRTPTVNSFVVS